LRADAINQTFDKV